MGEEGPLFDYVSAQEVRLLCKPQLPVARVRFGGLETFLTPATLFEGR
jgi:hypothetical protein